MSFFTRVPIPHFEERLRCLSLNKDRPVLHGEIALWIGCSLEQVTREMEPLLDSGTFRRVEESELRACCMEPRCVAYKLVKAA
jgi:hypothetical protein